MFCVPWGSGCLLSDQVTSASATTPQGNAVGDVFQIFEFPVLSFVARCCLQCICDGRGSPEPGEDGWCLCGFVLPVLVPGRPQCTPLSIFVFPGISHSVSVWFRKRNASVAPVLRFADNMLFNLHSLPDSSGTCCQLWEGRGGIQALWLCFSSW